MLQPFAGLGGEFGEPPVRAAAGAVAVAEGVQEHAGELVQDGPVEVPGHDRGQRRVAGGGSRAGPGQVRRSGYLRGGGAGGAPAFLQPGGAGLAAQLGQVHVHGQLGRLAVVAGQHPRIHQPPAALVLFLHRDLRHAEPLCRWPDAGTPCTAGMWPSAGVGDPINPGWRSLEINSPDGTVMFTPWRVGAEAAVTFSCAISGGDEEFSAAATSACIPSLR